MAFAVALGVVLLSRGGGFGRYTRYLVGDILTITPAEIGRLLILLALVVGVWVALFNRFFFINLNPALARSRGFRVELLETFFAALVAVGVTVSIPWVGLLVINALLVVPAAASRNLARNMPQYILGAVGISLFSGVAGLVASYYWNTATGATIVLFAMACFLLSLLFRRR
jgi:zinc transport system permease protein